MVSQPRLRFRNLRTGEEKASIERELFAGELWKTARFENHEKNTLAGARDRSMWLPVVSDWLTLHPGQIWSAEAQRALDPVHVPVSIAEGSLDDFLECSLRFFQSFEGRRIGVQLSGGVDSSLVIGLLRHFGISHGLLGLCSDRYEFRTERHVQEKLASDCEAVVLIDGEQCLPCSGLEDVPPHQVPDLLCLNHSQDVAMAQACEKLGIEVLLSGGGGDNLLGEAVPESPEQCEWRPQTFTDPFPADVVYLSRGIEFLSFFGDPGVVDSLYRLRRGQSADYSKRWARRFFRNFLPEELVSHTYCSDFWGRDIDGLLSTLSTIRRIHKQARELTGSNYFMEDHLEDLLARDLLRPTKTLYQQIEARISVAVWVCSLAGAQIGETS
jgi:asparagine synthetase B (glutamine-hydrolysing)